MNIQEQQMIIDVNTGIELKFDSGTKVILPGSFEVRNKERIQILSSGGGTQSTCLVVLMYMGILPKVDLIVTADTEREFSGVWPYLKKYVMPLVKEMGITYLIPKKSDWTDHDIVSHADDDVTLPPYYNEMNGRDKNNRPNKQPGFCSSKWKSEVLHRQVNHHYETGKTQGAMYTFWIGMTVDEKRRVKYPDGKWQKDYPLFELGITREDAIEIVKQFGLPEPPRSACWMCPNRSAAEWLWLFNNNPGDFAKAVAHEKELQEDFPWLWLTRLGVPLDEIDLVDWARQERENPNRRMDKNCDTGLCFV